MRKSGSVQHYFTVRGRGFDLKQWSRILLMAEQAVDRAKKIGLQATYDGNAWELRVEAPGSDPLHVVRKGEPGIPKLVTTSGKYDVLVQTILAAIKKIAPDIFEMSSPDGRDYRRLLAKKVTPPGQGAWGRMKRLDQLPRTKEEAFLKAMGKQKWRHPDTQNYVEFVSLPKREQTKLRRRWEQEFGDRYQRALEQVRSEADEAKKELKQVEDAREKLKEEQEKALQKMAQKPREGKEAKTMNEETIRKAAIRVAKTIDDPELKRELLEILRPTVKGAKEHDDEHDDEKKSRFEEGEDVDVGTWLKENGYEEAAKKWEKHEGEIGKKASASQVFPAMHKLAWHHVLSYAKANPESKVASGSTADRVAAAEHLARRWIMRAADRVHEYADTPAEELEAAVAKAAAERDTSRLYTLNFAKALRGLNRKTSADDAWLNEESFAKAAAEVFGSDHVAKKWISDAIKRPGRVREYLGVPEGKDIPMGKLDKAIEKVKGTGNKSLLSALLLAKRLKKMHKKQGVEKSADKWKDLPKGWTDKSRKEFWDSLTGRAPKHKVSACIKKMEDVKEIDDAGAFCAALADRVLGTTKWRGEDES